ncbi:hypothetical protein NE236_42030 [Actinoallomurus purpureus]|uniref:hypothetical protein n=1 Tax=Actinoallomurus purpureus TaxID=478114 RepID=UPI00209328CE|nr:hypothetical protein [Actinoallomurus purpureus]MCO6011551.1 hypothetical protein [Actinoallomurus purpureus]
MPDQSDLVRKMSLASMEAARTAAGKVIGDAIAAAHPDLPPLAWSAGGGFSNDPTWNTTGYAATDYDDAETRRIVALYAKALGGSEPREVERGIPGEPGAELETTATFEGIEVTVWGVLLDASLAGTETSDG